MDRIALKTLCLYFTVIYSIYINHILLVVVFKNILLYYILNRAIYLNFNPKEAALKLLILYNIFAKIATSSNLILKVNTNAAFYLTFIGCLYINKISYTNKQRFELLFTATKVIYLDIQFSPSKNHLIFYFI